MIDEERVTRDEIGEASGAAGMPRILQDLADGRLNDGEVDAVVAWLQATVPAPAPES